MRSNGLATVLLMIPVMAVPALAIFGVPQFTSVVDSISDSLQGDGRESRVGHSARQPNDEFFGDIEGFGSEGELKEEPGSKRQDTVALAANDRKSGTRTKNDSAFPGWDDDLDPAADLSSKQSRSTPNSPEQLDETEPIPVAKTARTSSSDRASKTVRRQQQNLNADDAVRLASATDNDQTIIKAAHDEDRDTPKSRMSTNGKRFRVNGSPDAKRRESTNQPLTWKTAVERLNEMDIRNFRIERGNGDGEFVFICSYTPSDSPRVSYRFEAAADEPLKAVEKVLEQIVEWQQRP